MDADNGCRWTDQPGDWDPCTPQQTPLTNRIELSQFLASGTSTHKTLKFAKTTCRCRRCLHPLDFLQFPTIANKSFLRDVVIVKDSNKQSKDISGCCCASFSLSFFGFLTCVLNNELCDLVKERVELGSNQPSTASSTCRTKWRLCTRNLC